MKAFYLTAELQDNHGVLAGHPLAVPNLRTEVELQHKLSYSMEKYRIDAWRRSMLATSTQIEMILL